MAMSADPVLFDATLRPNPPMSAAALRVVLAAVAAINAAIAAWFVLRGAWPVTPFMGADVALLAWAFRASRDAAARWEQVSLTPAVLRVDRHPSHGEPLRTEFNAYWVQVELEEPVRDWSRLTLASHGRSLQIGAFLPPTERLSVARALRTALRSARESRFV